MFNLLQSGRQADAEPITECKVRPIGRPAVLPNGLMAAGVFGENPFRGGSVAYGPDGRLTGSARSAILPPTPPTRPSQTDTACPWTGTGVGVAGLQARPESGQAREWRPGPVSEQFVYNTSVWWVTLQPV